MASVSFYQCTLSQYARLSSTNPNALYFVSDAGKLYKGDVDVTRNLTIVSGWESVGTPIIPNRLYLNTSNFEIRTYYNNTWYVVSPPISFAGTDFTDAAKEGYLTSIKSVKEYVGTKVPDIIANTQFARDIQYNDGSLFVNMGTAFPVKEVQLTGLANNPTYDATTLTLTIPVYGQDDLVVNLPKDSFVKSGRYEPNYLLPDGTYGPAIVLVVGPDGHEQEVVIPASALVNIYKGSKTPSVTVSVSDDTNVISASVNISNIEGNGLVEKGDGLYVKVSDFATKTYVDESVILVSDGSGGFKGGLEDVKIANEGDIFTLGRTYIATANVVAAGITAAVTAAVNALEPRIAALESKLSATFEDDEIVTAKDNKLKSSGVKVGGATLSDNPSDKVVATEAAVAAAQFDWDTIS